MRTALLVLISSLVLNNVVECTVQSHAFRFEENENSPQSAYPINAQPMFQNDDRKRAMNNDEDQNEPLFDHRRKNYFRTKPPIVDQSPQTCSSQMIVLKNTIIDANTSIKNNAKYIRYQDILPEKAAASGLNGLNEVCKQLCCQEKDCDTSLLTTRITETGYRCHLFRCETKCVFIKHKDYIVFLQKDEEQSQNAENQHFYNTDKDAIKTGQNNGACHKHYQFKCESDNSCIAIYDVCNGFNDCPDKSDEANCTTAIKGNKKTTKRPPKGDNDFIENEPVLIDADDDNSSDDYDEFKRMKQQAKLVEQLEQLEKAVNGNKDHVLFKTPQDLIDSLLLKNENNEKQQFSNKKKPTTSLKSTTSRPKIVFHDNFNMDVDTFMNWHTSSKSDKNDELVLSPADRAYFFDKALSSKSNVALAVTLLVLGIALVVAFFLYLLTSTKCIGKHLKFLNKNKKGKNNVVVEADYLINGMYL